MNSVQNHIEIVIKIWDDSKWLIGKVHAEMWYYEKFQKNEKDGTKSVLKIAVSI